VLCSQRNAHQLQLKILLFPSHPRISAQLSSKNVHSQHSRLFLRPSLPPSPREGSRLVTSMGQQSLDCRGGEDKVSAWASKLYGCTHFRPRQVSTGRCPNSGEWVYSLLLGCFCVTRRAERGSRPSFLSFIQLPPHTPTPLFFPYKSAPAAVMEEERQRLQIEIDTLRKKVVGEAGTRSLRATPGDPDGGP